MNPCFECGGPGAHNHHVVPQSLGGTRTVPLCTSCHALVHDSSLVAAQHLSVRAMQRRSQRGLWNGGRPPYGYKRSTTGGLDVEPEEADVVRWCFLEALGSSTNSIAQQLNSAGEVTRKGGRWTRGSVLSMLRNEAYRGVICWADQRVESAHPRLVDDDTWLAVQDAVAARPTAVREVIASKAQQRHPSAFRRCVGCPSCGRTMSLTNIQRWWYWRCDYCRGTYYREDVWQAALNGEVARWFKGLGDRREFIDALVAATDEPVTVDEVKALLVKLRRRIGRADPVILNDALRATGVVLELRGHPQGSLL